MAQTFRCPSCGAPLETDGKETSLRCEYCGETVVVPPELRTTGGNSTGSIPFSTPDPFGNGSPHGKMSSTQVRQMMHSIRSGQLDEAVKAFQEGTGATPEMANQTIQMISSQISSSNRILPAELAEIMMTYAQTANLVSPVLRQAAAPRRRQGGLGCWLPILIILLVAYFAYTALSPLNLAASLLAGNKNDPVLETAAAPFKQMETAVAPAIRKLVTPAPSSVGPGHPILASHSLSHAQGNSSLRIALPSLNGGSLQH